VAKNVSVVPAVVSSAVPVFNPEPILTPEQIAERLQLPSSKTVYELTRHRSGGRQPMPFFKAGKFLRFKWSEIERWLEESRRAA
jgi:predicted DNA-binding transcriptional regulator AlpA